MSGPSRRVLALTCAGSVARRPQSGAARLASLALVTPPCTSRGLRTSRDDNAAGSEGYTMSDSPPIHLPPLARIDPKLYAAVRPVPVSALAALGARLSLLPANLDAATRKRRLDALAQACTHPTFATLVGRAKALHEAEQAKAGVSGGSSSPTSRVVRTAGADSEDAQFVVPQSASNEDLSALGNSLLGMLATEFLHLRYPHLPTRALKAAVAAYVGPQTLADVGNELGVGASGLLRWDRQAESGRREGGTLQQQHVLIDATRALFALVFQELGLPHLRAQVQTQFLSRQVSMASLLTSRDPKRILSHTCAKYSLEAPVSRLIAETGRASISPIFVVGVWSGNTKLGEGTGSAIRMAEFRAAEDALRRMYLARTPTTPSLPSITLDDVFPSSSAPLGVWDDAQPAAAASAQQAFKPARIGRSEVAFDSRA